MPGAYDSNGIWIFDEDDPAAPFSDTLNLLAESTSDEIANDRARLTALEAQGNASSWVPTFTNATVEDGTVTAYYAQIGDLVIWQFRWILGSTSTITSTFGSSLPVNVRGSANMNIGGGFVGRGSGTTTGRSTLEARTSSATAFNLWLDGSSINGTSPLSGGTWVSGDLISVGGVYFAP
jgi:hypothetical protein